MTRDKMLELLRKVHDAWSFPALTEAISFFEKMPACEVAVVPRSEVDDCANCGSLRPAVNGSDHCQECLDDIGDAT